MRSYEFILPKITEDINGITNYLNAIYLIESQIEGKRVNDTDRLYLKGLKSDKPVVGKKYSIVLVSCYPNSFIQIFGNKMPTILEKIFIDEGSNLTIYQFENGKQYPAIRDKDLSFTKTYLFKNGVGLNEFLSAIALKFNTTTNLDESQLKELNIDNRNGWGQTPNNANVGYTGMLVQMKPSTFLKLAANLSIGDEERKTIDTMKAHAQSGGTFGAPTLYVKIPRDWEDGNMGLGIGRVTSHEGRHRMNVQLETEGDIPVETHIFISGFRTKNWAKDNQSDYSPEIIKRLQTEMQSEAGVVVARSPLFLG